MKSLLTLSLSILSAILAPVSAAEETRYGLDSHQFADTFRCATSAEQDYGAFQVFKKGFSLDALLRANDEYKDQDGHAQLDADEVDRLKRVYEAEPKSGERWAQESFEACLALKQVPLPNHFAGNCFVQTFLFSKVVSTRKANGETESAVLESYDGYGRDKADQNRINALISFYYARDPAKADESFRQDIRGFFACAIPDAVHAYEAEHPEHK